ncbi:MAG: hypothetical protein NZM13_09160 [Cyclobacteriaceae bacterium]|nr:hypothetical protein [Cyclobacteriaceae bacterium]
MKKGLFWIILMAVRAMAQSSYAPLNEAYYHNLERYEIKSGKVLTPLFTAVKPWKRSSISAYLDSAQAAGVFTSGADRFNYQYFINDNWEWRSPEQQVRQKPKLKHFYKVPADFFHVAESDFDLHVNPVLYAGLGKDSRLDETLFINTRGAEVRGVVDKKVGFYAFVSENQVRLPAYVVDFVNDTTSYHPVIPHEGFWKVYKNNKGYDFLQARGHISFEATKHINIQFGHDRFFTGNGYRSLILSDFAPPAWFVKGNVQVWKLNYLFSTFQMTGNVRGGPGGLRSVSGGYPQKFMAYHHLHLNIGKRLTVGVFESVVFNSDDSTGRTPLRLDYLNPVIFFRAIEQQNGSSDNVLLGVDVKWNATKGIQLYGQFVLDELIIENLRAGNGWWGNKFAAQAGTKYINAFGLPNLDLQAEVNVVRPYTYTHNTLYGSYSHYRQSLAHPLGANLFEVAGIVRYQPVDRLFITAKVIRTVTGRDDGSTNFGGDILKDSGTREQDFGNKIGQGFRNTIRFVSFTATYQIAHNFFVDAQVIMRNSKSELTYFNNNSTVTSLALRWNIPQRLYEF